MTQGDLVNNFAGLSMADAQTRLAAGQGNTLARSNGRSYWAIIRGNLLSYFSLILFTIGIVLAALGQYNDAFLTACIGIINAFIGTIQELRAKRQLDQISVLARPKITVVRDSQEHEVAASEIVRGDVIKLVAGDQVPADGAVLSKGVLELDESLLTGETDLIRKGQGDEVLSGSFCVAGEGYFEAQNVGSESFANKLTAAARTFEPAQTPLQANVNYVVGLVMVLSIIMAAIFYIAGFIQEFTLIENVKATAVFTGLIPYGLFLTIAVTYAMASVRIARQGALAQQSNAIESLNNVDVLCLDKTGTLTSGRMQLTELVVLQPDVTPSNISTQLGSFVRSATSQNATSEAILLGTKGTVTAVVDEVPFSSKRKWSALTFAETTMQGVYALGAVEMLGVYLQAGVTAELLAQVQQLSDRGLRVLLFAHAPTRVTLSDAEAAPTLPTLTPLALVGLSDELRPQVGETLAAFKELGVQLKIISGDNPRTVAALAKQVGFESPTLISGPELAQLSPTEAIQAAKDATIFGRITPEQKQQLVANLMAEGHYVAMIGDGVNDVLSLKKSTLGLAMESGSNAARNVADMVLLGDSFSALVPALRDGKRIVNGISDATYLLTARGLCYAFVIIGVMMVGLDFPFQPSQLGLTTFSVGIPAFMLTIFARPVDHKVPLLQTVVRFVLPFTVWTMLLGVTQYAYFQYRTPDVLATQTLPPRAIERFETATGLVYGVDAEFAEVVVTLISQSNLSNFLSIATMLLVFFLHPPISFFAVWRPVTPDKRPALMAIGVVILYLTLLESNTVLNYFGIVGTPGWVWGIQAGLLTVWLLGFRLILKRNLVERFLIPSV